MRRGLPIHGDPADEQTGQDIVGIVIGKYDHSATGWRDCDVVHRGDAHLPTIRQMDRERHKRNCVN